MTIERTDEIGRTKATNKAAKKAMETYSKDQAPKTDTIGKRAYSALNKAKQDKSGAVRRAVFRGNRAVESVLLEGLVKAANKAAKNKTISDLGGRKAIANSISGGKKGEEHSALNAAGVMRRQGKKNTSKLFLKASKKIRKGETFESTSLGEGVDDKDTDQDSIKNAGGDYDTYTKIKAAKQAKFDKKDKDIESNRDNTLGRMGGFKDKKGNPYKRKSPNSNSTNKEKPFPLTIKGKPGEGKKTQNVRGKSITTSRSTGEEGAKAQAHSDMFNRFYSKLAGETTKRVKLFKNGKMRVKD